jgi:hypothetical protein
MMVTMKIQRFLVASLVAMSGLAGTGSAATLAVRTLGADGDASAARMILELSDGSHLRTVAREAAGGFEVKSGDGWRLVTRDEVIAVRRESDVLAERRNLLDAIPLTHVSARVEACGWMVDQGLDQEASDELDRILRLVPDEPHVIRFMASKPPRIDLRVTPSSTETMREALLREGARTCNIGGSPVRRELVVRALRANEPAVMEQQAATEPAKGAADPSATVDAAPAALTGKMPAKTGATSTKDSASPAADGPSRTKDAAPKDAATKDATANDATLKDAAPADPLRAALVTELGSSVIARRTFACIALRRLYPNAAIGPMAVHAVLDPAVDVRDEAILGLRAARDPRACGMLVQALANPSGLVRENAIDAIGRAGYPEGVGPLMMLMEAASAAAAAGGGGSGVRSNLFVGLQTTYVQDYNVEIAQGASIADPIVGVLQSGVVFDVTVGGVSNIPITTEVWDTARALTRLTGERLGSDPAAWLKWWQANRHRYVPGASEHPTDTRDG